MNVTSFVDNNWFNDIQYGNTGAALFIITYIGCYGLSIICLFGQQLKATQRQLHELPPYFFQTLWDVPNKNRLYQELADVERLKQVFRGYFADHETCTTIGYADLQAMVEQRAYACALRYRQKLRRLHLSHTDYCLDTMKNLIDNDTEEKFSKSTLLTHTNIHNTMNDYTNRNDNENQILAISVV
ncbi:unnamed protein product [Rotaria sp. Silwood1]|nr:unnamed protein product [Rotaria sp. Silwood1]CAF1248190.1 unnamed protein product [Rotaria sp. Silwood1]CAF1255920.1 unnamed protein product [Rotaria sp. Silwood1]CAF3508653.1 unnamed protein product [Rotaria sp. Silwood1]CAF3521718.1 unnamed protein product [Rotaria sp. Silwood1]